MPCCTCCCIQLNGECCGPDGNKVCCKDPDVCCGTGESQVCCETPRECCTVYEVGVGESEVCCTETQYCCNDGQGVCCEVGEICCIGDDGATCCESNVVCCAGVCCAEGECCVDDACVPCECESDEDCPEGECCNDGVCGECVTECSAPGIVDLACPCEVSAVVNWVAHSEPECLLPEGWTEYYYGGERRAISVPHVAAQCYGDALAAAVAAAQATLANIKALRCVWPNDGSGLAGTLYAPALGGGGSTQYYYCCDGQCQPDNCDSPP